jgi:hypothetical protein
LALVFHQEWTPWFSKDWSLYGLVFMERIQKRAFSDIGLPDKQKEEVD